MNVIFESGLLKSKSEGRRMIKQGAVKLNDISISDIQATIKPGGKNIKNRKKEDFKDYLMHRFLIYLYCSIILSLSSCISFNVEKPKLVVILVVDQMRPDCLHDLMIYTKVALNGL